MNIHNADTKTIDRIATNSIPIQHSDHYVKRCSASPNVRVISVSFTMAAALGAVAGMAVAMATYGDNAHGVVPAPLETRSVLHAPPVATQTAPTYTPAAPVVLQPVAPTRVPRRAQVTVHVTRTLVVSASSTVPITGHASLPVTLSGIPVAATGTSSSTTPCAMCVNP